MSEGLKQTVLKKAQSILSKVDEETILTVTEKGNIKRFLSYYYDDVNAALDEATKQIREKARLRQDSLTYVFQIWIVELDEVLSVLDGENK